jgi:hypothetical protein
MNPHLFHVYGYMDFRNIFGDVAVQGLYINWLSHNTRHVV